MKLQWPVPVNPDCDQYNQEGQQQQHTDWREDYHSWKHCEEVNPFLPTRKTRWSTFIALPYPPTIVTTCRQWSLCYTHMRVFAYLVPRRYARPQQSVLGRYESLRAKLVGALPLWGCRSLPFKMFETNISITQVLLAYCYNYYCVM